jgi:hypothetical protein
MAFKNRLAHKYLVEAMAFSRSSWVDRARNRLEGALGEYAKIKYAEMIDFDFNWEPEVLRILKKVEELFDPSKVKLKSRFDLNKAFKEAVEEASQAEEQITAARNLFVSNYLDRKKSQALLRALQRHTFPSSEELLAEMLDELAPKLAQRLK